MKSPTKLALVPTSKIRVGVGQSLKSKKVTTLEFEDHAEFLAWLATAFAVTTKAASQASSIPTKDGQYVVAPMAHGERKAANAERAWHVCLDLDELGEHVTEALMRARLSQLGYLCAAWTTYSSVPEAPKWRVLFCLDSSLGAHDFALLQHQLEVTVRHALNCAAMQVDASASRPEQPQLLRFPGATYLAVTEGAPVPTQALLVANVPEPKQSELTITNPVADPVLTRLAEKGLLGQQLASGKWAMRCPWKGEHTTPAATDESDTVLYVPHHDGYSSWGFKCLHAHCVDRRFSPDVIEALELASVPGAVWDSDLMNARRFAQQNRDELRYTKEHDWLVWDASRWVAGRRDLAMQRAKEFAERVDDDPNYTFYRLVGKFYNWVKRTQSSTGLKALLDMAATEPGIAVPLAQFDADPLLLNCANGTLDLRTGTLQPHSRADYLTKVLSASYDPDAVCPTWDSFLYQVMGQDEDMYNYLQRAAGYSLTGLTDEQVFFFTYGSGANGKSVFLETLLHLVGEYGETSGTNTLMSRKAGGIPNDIAALRGTRFVAINETADNERFNEPLIKDLVGGDSISARFLYREFFTFRPEFKIWLRGNHKPAIYGTDHGIWRRVHIIPFTVTIPEAQQKPRLREDLAKELPGILAWAVRGCLNWQKDGLSPPPRVLDAVQDYRQQMDVLGHFLEECILEDKGATVRARDLYSAYRYWAEDNGEYVMSQTRFGKAIPERGFARFRTDKGYVYRGLRLKLG